MGWKEREEELVGEGKKANGLEQVSKDMREHRSGGNGRKEVKQGREGGNVKGKD